ncbi:hypothetical protein Q3G72_019445 [Acer saccharum]|nr:hypothetical protein Q3G72_019445 [Acer saccharum]
MSKKVLTQPMLASLPNASFVGEGATGDGNVKPTTDMSWTDKSMTAEEIAVIVPIHENILADADIDIFAAVRPKIAEAFALTLDAAVMYGVNAPATWTDADIVGKAITAANVVTRTSSSKLDLDFNSLLAKVEDDEYDVTDIFAVKRLRSQFRALRDNNGQPVYLTDVRDDGRTDSIYGARLHYLHKRVNDTVAGRATNPVEAIAIDRNQFQVGIREDLQVKILTEATVGGVNLAERDMVALRFKTPTSSPTPSGTSTRSSALTASPTTCRGASPRPRSLRPRPPPRSKETAVPIVEREDLASLGGLTISEAQFDAVDRRVRAMISAVYRGDIDAAAGQRAAVIESVYTSAALRILTNPTGARSVSLGSATISTGGSDAALAEPLSLTASERADLARVSGLRRPSSLQMTDPLQPLRLPRVPRESW